MNQYLHKLKIYYLACGVDWFRVGGDLHVDWSRRVIRVMSLSVPFTSFSVFMLAYLHACLLDLSCIGISPLRVSSESTNKQRVFNEAILWTNHSARSFSL